MRTICSQGFIKSFVGNSRKLIGNNRQKIKRRKCCDYTNNQDKYTSVVNPQMSVNIAKAPLFFGSILTDLSEIVSYALKGFKLH